MDVKHTQQPSPLRRGDYLHIHLHGQVAKRTEARRQTDRYSYHTSHGCTVRKLDDTKCLALLALAGRFIHGNEEYASIETGRPTGRPPLPLHSLHQEPSSRALFSRAKHPPGFTPTSPDAQCWAVKGCRCTPRDEPPGKQEEPDTTMRPSGTGPCQYGTLDLIGPALQRAARVEERDGDQWMGLF